MKNKTKILSLLALVVLVLAGVWLYSGGSFENLKGAFSTKSTGSLSISVSASTPKEDIVVAGSADVPVAIYEFTTTGEAFVVKSLSVNARQSGVSAASLGDYDNNISSITLSYQNSSGVTEEKSAYLVNGTASFSTLDFYIAADESEELTVYTTVNNITSSGASSTAGELLELNLAFQNFQALGQSSGKTFEPERIDASISTSRDLDFGNITYQNGDNVFELDGAQDVSLTLGSSLTLTIDDGAGDNSNNLPVGAMVCVDDNINKKCAKEDIYVVTSWPSSSSDTEDSVTVLAVDDAGDDNYDDNDPLLYALPGKGFLTSTNPMHVYESKPTFALSSSSPSGHRSVSAADDAFLFDVTADSNEKVLLYKLVIDISSDNDFCLTCTVTSGPSLRSSGSTVATGTILLTDASTGTITFSLPTTSPIEIAKGTTTTFTLNLDTNLLLDDDGGIDDPLVFSIRYGTSSDGKVSAGGIIWNDTNATVKWVGDTSTSSLSSNTVLY